MGLDQYAHLRGRKINWDKYYSDDDTATTWATTNYRLDNASVPSRFCLKRNISYPTGLRPTNGFEIQYVAGYGGASDVPQQIKQATGTNPCKVRTAPLNNVRYQLM